MAAVAFTPNKAAGIAKSSEEPSGNIGNPANRGCPNSAVDGLVEEAIPPSEPPKVGNTPSGRNNSDAGSPYSSGAFDAYPYIEAPP